MGIYMRFDNGSDIKGDSTQQGFEGKDGWMNLVPLNGAWTENLQRIRSGALTIVKPRRRLYTQSLSARRSTPARARSLEAATIDFKGKECEIAFLRTGNPGEKYLQVTLQNTLIKDLKVTNSGDARPNEDLVLDSPISTSRSRCSVRRTRRTTR